MMTFNDMIAKTRMYLDEVSAKSWTDTEVKREVNFAYQEFISAVIGAYEDFYLTQTAFDLVNTQQEYGTTDGVPSNIIKIRRVECNYDAATNPTAYQKAIPFNITQVRTSMTFSGLGSQNRAGYYVYGFDSSLKIGFIPIPTKDSTNGVKLWYVQEQSNLVLPTDPINIPHADRYAAGLPLIAAGTLLRKGQQEENVAVRYISEGTALKNQMVEELAGRVADEAKMIIDTIGQDIDFGNGI